MRMGAIAAVLIALAMPGAASAQGYQPPPFEIGPISFRLFYGYSGTLSDDISRDPDFAIWNTVIGEGSALEPADDMLVSVLLVAGKDDAILPDIELSVTDRTGKLIARRMAAPTLTNLDGHAVVGMMLHDVGCAGLLTATARSGDKVQTQSVDMVCGE